jgi:hypothetical protein
LRRHAVTPFQFFALSFLYSEELTKTQKEQFMNDHLRMRTHHSYSSVTSHPISVTVRELAIKMPPSMVRERLKTVQLLQQLVLLEERQYLERAGLGGDRGEYSAFSITTDGIMLVKTILSNLSKAIEDKQAYEKTIDKVEGSMGIKTWFKELRNKLRDKAQDEIADEILTGVKVYGPQLVGFAFRILHEYTRSQ